MRRTLSLREQIERWRDPAPARFFDPAGRPVYLLIAGALAVELAIIGATDFHLGESGLVRQFFKLTGMLALALVLFRLRFSRVAQLVESQAIPAVAGVLAVTATVLLSPVSLPFTDSWLDAADEALGFDFLMLLAHYLANPWLAEASRLAYLSFAPLAFLVPLGLALFGSPRRFWIYLNAWCLTLVVGVLVFPLAPAAGPFVFHGLPQGVDAQFTRLMPWDTAETIEALRQGSLRDVGLAGRSLVSLPSLHAAAAVLYAWAAWPSRWLRWPVALVAAALSLAAIVTGAHYLIDILAGLALGAAAIWAARRLAPATA